MRKLFVVMPFISALAACGGGDGRTSRSEIPDYSSMSSVSQVEDAIPEELRIPYQQLFSCRFELASRKGKRPSIDARFAGGVLESVARDPEAGGKCLSELRSHPDSGSRSGT